MHFGPKSLAPNSTVGLERAALVGTEQPLATPTSYLTLVPLLATMLFIMGRCGRGGVGVGQRHALGWAGVLLSRWLGRVSQQLQGDTKASPGPQMGFERALPPPPPTPGRLRHGLGAHHLAPHVGDPAPAGPRRGLRALRAGQLAYCLRPHQVLPAGDGEYLAHARASPCVPSASAHAPFTPGQGPSDSVAKAPSVQQTLGSGNCWEKSGS